MDVLLLCSRKNHIIAHKKYPTKVKGCTVFDIEKDSNLIYPIEKSEKQEKNDFQNWNTFQISNTPILQHSIIRPI